MKKKNDLTFHISGDWLSKDFVSFLSAVEKIYSVLLAAKIASKQIDERKVFLTLRHEDRFIAGELDSLRTKHFIEEIQSLKAKSDSQIDLRLVFPQAPDDSSYLEFIIENLITIAPNELLKINSIQMNSPGLISFSGLAEIFKEFRELMKDLWYRNSQEKELGRIEIARKYLEIKQMLVDDVNERSKIFFPNDRASIILLDNADVLKELEKNGKIDNLSKLIERNE